ncbi:MAG TPA: hypothetical protein VEJ63_21635 [Planctomycetota bacterium]|nr:hypothetical protein [Planctomycetota bacterium]
MPALESGTASAQSLSLSQSSWTAHVPFVLLLAYCTYLFQSFLFSTDALTCPDGFFHARYAAMLPERGLSREFPWLQFTTLKDNFWDNHFLYNILLTPFCLSASEPLVGAKIATVVFQIALLTVFYVVLWRLRVPWPLLWVALLAAGSAAFLMRILMVRSQVLSVALMILSLYFIMRQRFWICFALGFIYSWTYSAPLAVFCTALGAEVAQLVLCGWRTTPPPDPSLKGRGVKFPRMTLAIALGLIAGHLIHPYSPLTIDALLAGLHVTRSAVTGSGSVELGSEYRPMGLEEILYGAPGPAVALIVATAVALWLRFKAPTGKALSIETAQALGAASGWFLGLFLFRRVIEYAAPLTILACALALRDTIGSREQWRLHALTAERRLNMLALGTVAGLALVAGHYWSWLLTKTQLRGTRAMFTSEEAWKHGRFYENAAAWMRKNIPAGTTIVNFYWDEFPELYYTAPEFYYVGGMDPTLMRIAHPEQSAALERMRIRLRPDGNERADGPLDLAKLAELFGTDYMVLATWRALKYPELKRGLLPNAPPDAIRPVYADAGAAVYRLR